MVDVSGKGATSRSGSNEVCPEARGQGASRLRKVTGRRFKPPDNDPLINVNNRRLPNKYRVSSIATCFRFVRNFPTFNNLLTIWLPRLNPQSPLSNPPSN